MDITALSSSLASVSTGNDISTLLLSKSLDTFEEQGMGMVKMMEQSVNPSVGANIDVRL